jgi:hypothetical protein
VYQAPITHAELNYEAFYTRLVPFRKFNFNGMVFHMNATTQQICDANFYPFYPKIQFDAPTLTQFDLHVSNHNDFEKITENAFMPSIVRFSNAFNFNFMHYCNDPVIGMFCDPTIFSSMLRFKLFFAFGLLHNFVQPVHFRLMIRGGMALRMNLKQQTPMGQSYGLTDKESAPNADMDGLVIVDPSITEDRLEAFKTGFMKLLVMTISNSIQAPNFLICRSATGDANTIKLMIKQRANTVELADTITSFLYCTYTGLIYANNIFYFMMFYLLIKIS